MGLIKGATPVKEGEIFCKWLNNRLLVQNKNVLGAELGATGSGKSYRDLRKAEIWYRDYLKRPFPKEHICFGVISVMRLLSNGNLKKGDIIITEEAGANLGSLDFQNQVSKMFVYVLQSFRSMNIAIFFNLPYLSMLNKSARMLLHYSGESAGIDFQKNINKSKMFFHQVNQSTGKIYKKYMRAKIGGKIRTVERFNWKMPNKDLVESYEAKKTSYLSEMTKEYTTKLEMLEKEKVDRLGRKELDGELRYIYEKRCEGRTYKEIAEKMNCTPQTIFDRIQTIKKRGFKVEKRKIPKENEENKS